jgi:hypothetical protein
MLTRCCLPVALVALAAAQIGSSDGAQADKPTRAPICPVYKVATFEDYRTYYAIDCPMKSVAYNHKDELGSLPRLCSNPGTCFTARREGHHHNHDEVIRCGLSRKYDEGYEPHPGTDSVVLDRVKVKFKDHHSSWIKAKLFLIKTDHVVPDVATYPAFIGTGVEIHSGSDFKEVKNPVFDGKVCHLQVGSMTYCVVLHSDPGVAVHTAQPEEVHTAPCCGSRGLLRVLRRH